MEDTLIDEAPTTGSKKPEPVILKSAHDYSLTQQALEVRKEDLKKLAKKTSDEGYRREARNIQADADAIEHHILPSFRSQRELPFVTGEQLDKEIAGALSVFVARAFDGLDVPNVKLTKSGMDIRKSNLLKTLTARVSLFAIELADEAFNQGAAARQQSAEALAFRYVSTLRAAGD